MAPLVGRSVAEFAKFYDFENRVLTQYSQDCATVVSILLEQAVVNSAVELSTFLMESEPIQPPVVVVDRVGRVLHR